MDDWKALLFLNASLFSWEVCARGHLQNSLSLRQLGSEVDFDIRKGKTKHTVVPDLYNAIH